MPEELPLVPVGSSNIDASGYDPATQTLKVQFKNGGIYEYPNVTEELARAFSEAPSKGKFVAQILRPLGTARKVPDAGK